ncbi:hypothetical protein IJJ12_03105 [bacterium]|nr:hypothetical protein [bacterium]
MSQTVTINQGLSREERVRLSYAQPSVGVPESIDATRMSREELVAHVMAGYEDYLAGRTIPADEVFEEIRRDLKSGKIFAEFD